MLLDPGNGSARLPSKLLSFPFFYPSLLFTAFLSPSLFFFPSLTPFLPFYPYFFHVPFYFILFFPSLLPSFFYSIPLTSIFSLSLSIFPSFSLPSFLPFLLSSLPFFSFLLSSSKRFYFMSLPDAELLQQPHELSLLLTIEHLYAFLSTLFYVLKTLKLLHFWILNLDELILLLFLRKHCCLKSKLKIKKIVQK